MRRTRKAPTEESQDRQAEPVDREHPPRLDFAVVGIGASAGGLEAFSDLLNALPDETGLAYVFIQHLPPDRESLLADILAKRTRVPVLTVTDGMKVRPDHIYVIRPGYTVTLRDGQLRLGDPLERRGHRRPVDDFFRSLAEEQRERAICVVMSGMGSNGTSGAQVVKAAGGICIAQDPDSARFPSMPRTLIEHGYADYVLRPEEIPAALTRYARHPYAAAGGDVPSPAAEDRQHLREILAVIRARTRRDFSGYKQPTLVRRIQRRMGLRQVDALADYARILRQHPSEVEALADDIMIHVSGFFRDGEAWETMRTRVIEPLVASREDGATIRAWVSACASGEEAYTLAILLMEAVEASGKTFDVKIFATDTADRTLSQARAGVYPGGIESEVSGERLERFFDRDEADYRIKKEVRQLVVFAPQNVLQDSPFSRLDICSCRNLLIYLEPAVQRRVLGLLHFGLREGGALFLGTSETVAGSEDLFEPIDKKWRVFRRVGPARRAVQAFSAASARPRSATAVESLPSRASIGHLASAALLDRYTPASVVVDRDHQVVHYHGRTDHFLVQPSGEPTRDLLALSREPLRGALRTALHKAVTQHAGVDVRDGLLDIEGVRRRVVVRVDPLGEQTESPFYLVAFQAVDEPPPLSPDRSGGAADPARIELEAELRRARDELQSTIEELQTSNEEMKATNEELTSVNEELQSANEELETSKEELLSMNEELTTVNAQLHSKMAELEGTTNDLGSLLSSTDIAVVFLDLRFRIRRYTPVVRDLFELIPADVDRPLSDLARKFHDPALLPDARAVAEKLVPIEREIPSDSGRTYVRRALPYRTSDNRIDGIVLTFVDVTERARALQAARRAEERLLRLTEASGIGLWEYDIDRQVIFASARAREILGLPPIGDLDRVGVAQVVFPEFADAVGKRARLLLSAPDDASFREEVRLRSLGETPIWVEFMGRISRSEEPPVVRGTIREISARKGVESAQAEAREQAEAATRAKDHFIANVSHELRTPVAAILMWARLLRQPKSANPDQLQKGLDAIVASAETQRQLVEDLLDTARIVSGHLQLRFETVDAAALVRAAAESFRPAASAAGVTLTIRVTAGTGEITADPGRVSQILWNLIGNALKFTPRTGAVRVSVSRRGGNLVFVVADTGRGIAREELPAIFERFGSTKDPSRDGSGLGLGLSIARDLARLHGGSLEAESDGAGHGARFLLSIPIAPAG